MKTTSFGISAFLITVVTLIIIAEINLGATRQSLLEDNLNDGMSAALQMALDERGYSIGDENELVTDIVEYLSLYVLEDYRCRFKYRNCFSESHRALFDSVRKSKGRYLYQNRFTGRQTCRFTGFLYGTVCHSGYYGTAGSV